MGIENVCSFIGHLGDAPTIRPTKGKTPIPVANFSVAVNEKFKETEVTTWVNVVAFNELARVMKDYTRKGSHVAVQGRMQNRSWEDKDGNTRYNTEIIANSIKLLDKKPGGTPGPDDLPPVPDEVPPGVYVPDSDIPF
jgi:single-strand DNA-binding protein